MVATDLVEVRLKPVWACGGACVEDRNDNYYGDPPAPKSFEVMGFNWELPRGAVVLVSIEIGN